MCKLKRLPTTIQQLHSVNYSFAVASSLSSSSGSCTVSSSANVTAGCSLLLLLLLCGWCRGHSCCCCCCYCWSRFCSRRYNIRRYFFNGCHVISDVICPSVLYCWRVSICNVRRTNSDCTTVLLLDMMLLHAA
jgi:hypothetical protein